MANRSGWWKLQLEETDDDLGRSFIELSDADREHIARLIIDGFTEGEIVKDEDEPDNDA